MDATEFQELMDYIRDAIDAPLVGLSIQEMYTLGQRLDSDAYKATVAVTEFFDAKRAGTI